jgi:DNA topoisomerase-1
MKKKEDEADTVGCCSLRVEHISILADCKITLDFLGKDSMRYYNTIVIDSTAHANMSQFIACKQSHDNVFHLINSDKLNAYLNYLMDGLTAKVFRTFNASDTLQTELDKASACLKADDPLETKIEFYTRANRSVALLCNHQKGISKTAENVIAQRTKQIKKLKSELSSTIKKHDSKHSRTQKLKQKIEKLSNVLQLKNDNKAIALSTSKINYNDPRISVAWCKKYEVPIESIFTHVLLEKFNWAMETKTTWKF